MSLFVWILRSWLVLWLLAALAGVAHSQQEKDTAASAYAAAVKLQNAESYKAAADAWVKFLKDFPAESRADRAHYYLGICHLKEK